MGVSLTTVEALRAANHDALHLRDEGVIRLPDPDIVMKALAESRIVLTFDLLRRHPGNRARRGDERCHSRLRTQTTAAVNRGAFASFMTVSRSSHAARL